MRKIKDIGYSEHKSVANELFKFSSFNSGLSSNPAAADMTKTVKTTGKLGNKLDRLEKSWGKTHFPYKKLEDKSLLSGYHTLLSSPYQIPPLADSYTTATHHSLKVSLHKQTLPRVTITTQRMTNFLHLHTTTSLLCPLFWILYILAARFYLLQFSPHSYA